MNRLERLYAIGEVVRREGGRPVTTAQLAEQFEVSRRTIERDLAALRRAGVPLYGEQGRNGGMVSLEFGAGAIVNLSTAEVTALLVAVAANGPDMPFAVDAVTATERLLESLAPSSRTDVDELRQKVRYRLPSSVVSSRVRRTVEEGVRRGVVLNIAYSDESGRRTERSVEAVGFYRGTEGWFLVAWCRLRDAGRIFRLDRIEVARLTKRPIAPRDVDDVLGWVPSETAIP